MSYILYSFAMQANFLLQLQTVFFPKNLPHLLLRWLNTVLRAVSGNLRDGASFKLDNQTWRRKSNDTKKPISQNLLIKIL